MKKTIIAMTLMVLVLVSGCQKASDLISPPSPEPTPYTPVSTNVPMMPGESEELKNKIVISQNLKMTNEWTILGDYDVRLTGRNTKDRVVLGTSAKESNGEVMWDDSQYWTVAVLNEDGAYNLFSQRMSGQVYMEVSEAFVNGFATPIITVYVFSGADREIRNYSFVDDCFEETIVYSTKQFSTGGVNNLYSTLPENKAR